MPDRPTKQDVDALALSLGRVIITSARLEHQLTMSLAAILSLNEVQERALLRPMGTSQKVTLLRRIAKGLLLATDSKRVGEIGDLITKIAEQRNDLVHGLYVQDKEDHSPAVLTFSGAARIRSKPKRLTARELELLTTAAILIVGASAWIVGAQRLNRNGPFIELLGFSLRATIWQSGKSHEGRCAMVGQLASRR